jgi:hypothetical protein
MVGYTEWRLGQEFDEEGKKREESTTIGREKDV